MTALRRVDSLAKSKQSEHLRKKVLHFITLTSVVIMKEDGITFIAKYDQAPVVPDTTNKTISISQHNIGLCRSFFVVYHLVNKCWRNHLSNLRP